MKLLAGAVALALVASSPVFAQPKSESQAPAREPRQEPVKAEQFSPVETINVGLGEAKLIKINRMIGDVQASVNNVVRTAVMGDKFMLSVTGVSPGATDLVIVNQYSEVIYIARVNVSGGLEADEGTAPHIVRIYGWSETKPQGGSSAVTIINGDSKAPGNSDTDFTERYCSPSGCSQPISRAAHGAGLDATDPQKSRE